MKLVMIVPSRGRPHNVAEVIEEFAKTKSKINTQLIIGIDEDDPELTGYEAIMDDVPNFVMFHKNPRLRLGGTLNLLANRYAPYYDLIGFMGDDHRTRTYGWDTRFSDTATADGTAVMYGNDLIQGSALPTAVVMTADIIKTLGYMVPPTLTHLFLDNYWLTLGRRLSRLRYLDDVIIEHMHPIAGKGAWDDRYADVNSQAQWSADEAAFNDYVNTKMLDRDVHAIMQTW